MRVRLAATFALLATTLLGVVSIFWYQELQYALPTPVPIQYKEVAVGASVELAEGIGSKGSAYYFHFYNPDCPCSLFNADHVRQLIEKYHSKMQVVVVVPQATDVSSARKEFGDQVQVWSDGNGKLANTLGVYSTPQAAIVDSNHQLYFRGNYNRSRYCTANATNFAELALIAYFNKRPPPPFDLWATQSYGCSLPQNKNSQTLTF
jgi:hypothetical protein